MRLEASSIMVLENRVGGYLSSPEANLEEGEHNPESIWVTPLSSSTCESHRQTEYASPPLMARPNLKWQSATAASKLRNKDISVPSFSSEQIARKRDLEPFVIKSVVQQLYCEHWLIARTNGSVKMWIKRLRNKKTLSPKKKENWDMATGVSV